MSGRFIFYCLSCGGIALVSYIMAAVLHEGTCAVWVAFRWKMSVDTAWQVFVGAGRGDIDRAKGKL